MSGLPDNRLLTKGQALAVCDQVYPLMSAATDLLDPKYPMDLPTLKVLLERSATLLSAALNWQYDPSESDTGISRDSLIAMLLPATAGIGAARRLARDYLPDLPDELEMEGAWRMLAESLIAIRDALKTSTFRLPYLSGPVYHNSGPTD